MGRRPVQQEEAATRPDVAGIDARAAGLSRLAGKLLIMGSAAMILGCLFSWNFFRVGPYHFYGKVLLSSGRRLTVLILGVIAAFHARTVLLQRISPMRLRRYWASVILTGSLGLLALAQYAATEQRLLERWVVDTYSTTIAERTATPVAAVKNVLQAAIARHDVQLTLRGGFYVAVAGVVLVLAAGALLLVDTKRSHTAIRSEGRGPRSGLKDVMTEP